MVRYERTGATAVVTIDRPERRNAVDGPTAAELLEAYERFAADDGARVMVLTGAGEQAFCAGADLKSLETLNPDAPGGPMGFTRITPAKPAIAAVRGWSWPAASSWRCGAICGSRARTRASAAWSGAGASR
jgi:enoyl-CoA hydratase